mgnify:CR=1 FL=1
MRGYIPTPKFLHTLLRRYYDYEDLNGFKDIAFTILARSSIQHIPYYIRKDLEDLGFLEPTDAMIAPLMIDEEQTSEFGDYVIYAHPVQIKLNGVVSALFNVLHVRKVWRISRKTLGFISNLVCACVLEKEMGWECYLLLKDWLCGPELDAIISRVPELSSFYIIPDILAFTYNERRPYYLIEVKSRRRRYSSVNFTYEQRLFIHKYPEINLLSLIDYRNSGVILTLKAMSRPNKISREPS